VANLDAALRAAAGLSLRVVAAPDGTYRLVSASCAGSTATLRALAQDCRAANATRGEAACSFYAGVVAFDCSDHAAARALYEQARPLFQQVGDLQGEAICLASLGRVAQAEGDVPAARTFYAQALILFEQLHATHSEALAHEDIARVTTAAERAGHVAAARAAWASMDLPEQVARVEREFG
jgi:tetratricopeptide (TPR) repeat protein